MQRAREVVTVPEGMSYVNALYALYVHVTKVRGQKSDPRLEVTRETIQQLFQEQLRSGLGYSISAMKGILLEVNFDAFDTQQVVEVSAFNKTYGIGSAQRAIDAYARRISKTRLDKGDKAGSLWDLEMPACDVDSQ